MVSHSTKTSPPIQQERLQNICIIVIINVMSKYCLLKLAERCTSCYPDGYIDDY